MPKALINLKVLLPFQIFLQKSDVTSIVAETNDGSYGILPNRLDCVAALKPGILVYETESGTESYIAVDEGVMVKTGLDVLISVRRAIAGSDLGKLHESVEKEFKAVNEIEQGARTASEKLEAGFIRRFAELTNE
jgi:F-type H+-transporting ATPase subunit epsilon